MRDAVHWLLVLALATVAAGAAPLVDTDAPRSPAPSAAVSQAAAADESASAGSPPTNRFRPYGGLLMPATAEASDPSRSWSAANATGGVRAADALTAAQAPADPGDYVAEAAADASPRPRGRNRPPRDGDPGSDGDAPVGRPPAASDSDVGALLFVLGIGTFVLILLRTR